MIERLPEREARLKRESAEREANIRRYEAKMGVELPYSPVNVVERKPPVVPVESFEHEIGRHPYPAKEKATGGSRAAYMKAFRQRPVVCPHCGKVIERLQRQIKSASSSA